MLKQIILFILVFSAFFTPIHAEILHVNTNSTATSPDGSTWANAYQSLRDALFSATANDEIWVAQGTYFPSDTDDRGAAFNVQEGAEIYGGFTGNETLREQRDWTINTTILSGDIGVSGDSTDNSYTVLLFIYTDSTTIVDGFTIRDGNADSDDPQVAFFAPFKCGGGAYVLGQGGDAAPTIRNCYFTHNHARENGGGLFLNARLGGNVHGLVDNCVFEANSSTTNGGGMSFVGGNEINPVTIINSDFDNNYAATEGGGLYIELGHGIHSLTIEHCNFSNNNAGTGGGISSENVSLENTKLNIEFSNFSKNSSQEGGGMIYESLSSNVPMSIYGCQFIDNNSIINGASIVVTGLSSGDVNDNLRIDSCYFSSNAPNSSGLSIGKSRPFYFNKCTFENHMNTVVALEYTANAYFDRCLFINNEADVILASSNTINITNSIFYQNNGDCIRSFNSNSMIDISNTTFVANKNGIRPILRTSNLQLYNSIFFDNETIDTFPVYASQNLEFTNNLFDVAPSNNLIGIDNIYQSDPFFADTTVLDFSLLPCSPAINTGTNTVIEAGDLDFNGQARIIENTVDIGAIESPAAELISATTTPTACLESSTGEVLFDLINHCEPMTYSWQSDMQNGSGNTELKTGNYQFTITDATGRTFETSIEIASGEAIEITTTSSNIDCTTGEGGTAQVTTNTGSAPYEYAWSNGAMDSLLTDLAAGDYSLTLTDANGCTDSTMVAIFLENELPVNLGVSALACFGDMDASITVFPATEGDFDYEWSENGAENAAVLSNVGAGTYTVTVTEMAGCTAIASVNISEPDELNATFNITPSTTPDSEDGGIEIVEITGGTMPYTLSWDTTFLVNINAGIYSLTITDGNACSQTYELEVDYITSTFSAQNADLFITILPNPIAKNAHYQLKINALHSGLLNVQCVNALGQTIGQIANTRLPEGEHLLELNAPNTAGMYWLVGTYGEQFFRVPFVVE